MVKANKEIVKDDVKKVDTNVVEEVKVPKNVLEIANLTNESTEVEVVEEKEEKIIVNELENKDLDVKQVVRIIEELEFNELNRIAYGDLKDELARYGVERHFKIGKTKESIINDALRELEKLKLKLNRENSIEENARLQVEERGIKDKEVLQKNIDMLNKCLKNDVTPTQRRLYLAKREAIRVYMENL